MTTVETGTDTLRFFYECYCDDIVNRHQSASRDAAHYRYHLAALTDAALTGNPVGAVWEDNEFWQDVAALRRKLQPVDASAVNAPPVFAEAGALCLLIAHKTAVVEALAPAYYDVIGNDADDCLSVEAFTASFAAWIEAQPQLLQRFQAAGHTYEALTFYVFESQAAEPVE